MKGQDFRQLGLEDLRAKVKALREDLFRVKFQHATAQLSDSSQIGKTRKDLARAMTVLGELERTQTSKQEG